MSDAVEHWADLTPGAALAFLRDDHDAAVRIIEALHLTEGEDDEHRTLTIIASMTHLLAEAISETGGCPAEWLQRRMLRT